jgi:hypothetical protein
MSMKLLFVAAALIAVSFGCGNVAAGGKARIERAAAEKLALARVPGGEVTEAELETEHGRLVWSFDIAQKTSPDITEVQVDANTGEVVAVETETPDDQAREDDEDKKDDEDQKDGDEDHR